MEENETRPLDCGQCGGLQCVIEEVCKDCGKSYKPFKLTRKKKPAKGDIVFTVSKDMIRYF